MPENDTMLLKVVRLLKSIHGDFFDPMCVVNASNEVIHANLMMRQLLGIATRQMEKKPIFCNYLSLQICRKECGILRVIHTAANLRLHETPALIGTTERRIILSAHPLLNPWAPQSKVPIGALIVVRDMTTEVQLQMKYSELQAQLKAKTRQITELERDLLSLKIKHRIKGTEKTKTFTRTSRG